ncbi:MAG TPA: helix-turn-helix transcriptional regulator, partial [Candidatus Binataceae bacterium]|nr:helix-turn-helix transcriptional regulator [Candidatus Binataceae bacterium]
MSELRENLKREFRDREYREAYADSFVNTFVAMQIRAIREQRGMTQKELAEKIGTAQTGVSRLENANYSGRSISTLKNVARQFDCWLRVSFEGYGSLIDEADRFGEDALRRPRFEEDIAFSDGTNSSDDQQGIMQLMKNATANTAVASPLGSMVSASPGNKVISSSRRLP